MAPRTQSARAAAADVPGGAWPRLFIALWPPSGVAEALQARWAAAAAGGEPPARLHLTLHFLGAVAPALLPQLLAATAAPCVPFALCFTGFERWPGNLWVARPDPVPPELLTLHADLALALAALGLRTDPRAFRPHVTLARRHAGACAPLPPGLPPLIWPVRGCALVQSLPGPPRRYRVLQAGPRRPG